MRTLTFTRAKRLVALLTGLLSACSYFVSWEEGHRSAIGHHISEIIKLEGPPEEITPLKGGAMEYKYHFKKVDPTCVHWWLVDRDGVITGFRYEGDCRSIG